MIKSFHVLRRKGRAWKRAGEYPILLPHFAMDGEGLVGPMGEKYVLDEKVREAVKLCDGTRRLGEIAVGGAKVMELYDEGKMVLWREPLKMAGPEELVDTIVISPHPDDAALSVAHQLLGSHGESVMVVDVFSRTGWWRLSGEGKDVERISAVRFAEEKLIARMANLKLRTLGLPEGLLRGHRLEEIFECEVGERDREVEGQIRDAVAEMVREHPHAKWYLPLGVGGHVDHRMVRDVGYGVLKQAGVRSVRFYEELFYAAEVKGDGDFSGMVEGVKLSCSKMPVEMKWKMELCRVYWSQFTAGRVRVVEEYAKRAGNGRAVERVWTA